MAGAGTTILKRVAFLNRSGSLAKPLRYSEVKDSLEALDEEGALEVLRELEEQSSDVPDPAAFIKSKVAASGSKGSGAKRKASQLSKPDGATAGGDGIVAKRIRLLNASGRLMRPVSYNLVHGALDSVDVGQAMVILTGLEDAAGRVRDPTSYIRAAVRAVGGSVPADMDDAAPPNDEEEEMDDAGEEKPRGAVKKELGTRFAKVENGKGSKGKGKGKGKWGKTENLSDEEKLSRRIEWMNDKLGFDNPIVESQVMTALDCVGVQQAMRILRRLEENSAEAAADPNQYLVDAVARAGWIWSKPDIIDDDEKVAKRVSWMNQFGGLACPIDYAEVADLLDGLKVPHAMVLLRELEMTGTDTEDPTAYIKQQISLAGVDDVQLPEVDAAREDSAIGQRIASMNESGILAAPIEFSEVLSGLTRIGDAQAMSLLQELESKGPSTKDPTGFLKFKLKSRLAAMGFTLEEARDTETEILKRVEWLNDYGGIAQDIDYNQVAAPLEALGIEHAMTILKELEDKRATVRDPTAFVRQAATLSARQKAEKKKAVQAQPAAAGFAGRSGQGAAKHGVGAAGSGNDFKTLSGFVNILNKRSKKPVKFTDIAGALDTLGTRASVVLREMQEKGLGLDDPSAYINAAAFRVSKDKAKVKQGGEEDDVQKLTRKMNWLNQFGGLVETIKMEEVVGALYCLGVPQSMAILKGLQEKGAKVKDPTQYIKTAVQRANGMVTAKVEPEAEEEEAEEDEAAAEAAYYAEASVWDFEDAAEQEAEGLESQAADAEMYDEDIGNEAELAAAAAVVDAEWEGEIEGGPATRTNPNEVRQMISKRNAQTSYFPATEPKEIDTKAAPAKRVVGAVTGYNHFVPKDAKRASKVAPRSLLEAKEETEGDEPATQAPGIGRNDLPEAPASEQKGSALPITPQEKMVQIRNLALKVGLHFDEAALKALARLPFYRAKDLIDEVLLGGKNRRGINNPSRYVINGVQRMSLGLGVEQGLAMELAVSVGVVLNNEALDELASLPRKESHAIIKEVALSEEAQASPITYIKAKVAKIRAAAEARPFGMRS